MLKILQARYFLKEFKYEQTNMAESNVFNTLNPGLKVLQGIWKIGKFYDLATLIKIAQWWRKLGF